MTREEAIKIIERVDICANAAETARDMAIAALKEPETVLCKDCKHFVTPQGLPCCDNYFGLGFPHPSGYDFCSYGERRT